MCELKTIVQAVFSLQFVSSEAFNDVQYCYDDSRMKILHKHGFNSVMSIKKLMHVC